MYIDPDTLSPTRKLDAARTLFVVSPHLDDAVFGCAALLAARPGARVCTVFAGTPPERQNTEWDRAAGYADSTHAMRGRCREDDRALDVCHAKPVRLDFLDGQYGPLPDTLALSNALIDTFAAQKSSKTADDTTLVVPLGVHHPDHVRVGEAWTALLRAGRVPSCIVYEDAIHRAARGVVEKRLTELDKAGLRLTALDATWCPERLSARALDIKRRGIVAYDSQLRAFGERMPADLAKPERFWRVERV